jgi:hypothetical protein
MKITKVYFSLLLILSSCYLSHANACSLWLSLNLGFKFHQNLFIGCTHVSASHARVRARILLKFFEAV